MSGTDAWLGSAVALAYLRQDWDAYWDAVERFPGSGTDWSQLVAVLDHIDREHGKREPPRPPRDQRAAIDVAAFTAALGEIAALTGEEVRLRRRWRR
jgi:hypothetical protein